MLNLVQQSYCILKLLSHRDIFQLKVPSYEQGSLKISVTGFIYLERAKSTMKLPSGFGMRSMDG